MLHVEVKSTRSPLSASQALAVAVQWLRGTRRIWGVLALVYSSYRCAPIIHLELLIGRATTRITEERFEHFRRFGAYALHTTMPLSFAPSFLAATPKSSLAAGLARSAKCGTGGPFAGLSISAVASTDGKLRGAPARALRGLVP